MLLFSFRKSGLLTIKTLVILFCSCCLFVLDALWFLSLVVCYLVLFLLFLLFLGGQWFYHLLQCTFVGHTVLFLLLLLFLGPWWTVISITCGSALVVCLFVCLFVCFGSLQYSVVFWHCSFILTYILCLLLSHHCLYCLLCSPHQAALTCFFPFCLVYLRYPYIPYFGPWCVFVSLSVGSTINYQKTLTAEIFCADGVFVWGGCGVWGCVGNLLNLLIIDNHQMCTHSLTCSFGIRPCLLLIAITIITVKRVTWRHVRLPSLLK